MKKIVTLALLMLIGGYGMATGQAQMVTETEVNARVEAATRAAYMKDATEMEEATKEFLGLKWGLGIGVMGGFGGDTAVEKVSLVGTDKVVRVDEEGDMRPQMFLEMHVLLGGFGQGSTENKVKDWRRYQREKAAYRIEEANNGNGTLPKKAEPPLMGFGPFVALQGSDEEVIDALALGVLWGFRKDPKASNSLNIGVGVSFDPSVQVLGGGQREGDPLRNGETEVRLKKEGQFGWVLMTSFTF